MSTDLQDGVFPAGEQVEDPPPQREIRVTGGEGQGEVSGQGEELLPEGRQARRATVGATHNPGVDEPLEGPPAAAAAPLVAGSLVVQVLV